MDGETTPRCSRRRWGQRASVAVGLVIVVLGIGGAAAGGTASEPCLFETLVTCPGAGAPPVSYTHLTLPTICSV